MQDNPDLLPRRPRRRLQENMDEDEEWKAELVRYILFAFNIIIFFFAGTLLGVSIWMAVERSFMTHIIGNDWYAAAIYLGLCCGAIIFFVSFLGCYGAMVESKKLLKVFLVILIFVAVVLLFTGIVAGVFRAQIGSSVKRSMSNTLTNYYDVDLHRFFNRAVTRAWDKAQQRLYCCAVDDEGWALYRESKWFEKFGAKDDIVGIRYGHDEQKPYVPESCCVTDTYYNVLNVEICQKWKLGPPGTLAKGAYNHGINYNGCFNSGVKYLKENTGIIIGFGITLCVILILGIILTFYVIRRL